MNKAFFSPAYAKNPSDLAGRQKKTLSVGDGTVAQGGGNLALPSLSCSEIRSVFLQHKKNNNIILLLYKTITNDKMKRKKTTNTVVVSRSQVWMLGGSFLRRGATITIL